MDNTAVVELMIFESVKKRFDLLSKEGLYQAYQFIENDYNYQMTYLGLDWAEIDNYTSLDDVVEVLSIVTQFNDKENRLFENKVRERIDTPIDIALSIKTMRNEGE
ncbi:hypothetical protein RW115_12105 [Macrococcus capreoli]